MPTTRWATSAPSPQERPKDVGIHGIELYFPLRCISETDLEQFDGVSAGKYTLGLGQERMAFCDDREDINSFLLTVTASLMAKYEIPPTAIGRIDVGTETLIDKSKSVKTHLMDLFALSGNTDIEGIDSKNACYGGTAALFNAVNWIESSSWDGRYALVVAGDIAIYAEGGARPVGGAGAVAMLIGPNAPLVMEPVHGTHMANVYDFYKPHLSSEYPEVDGPLTQTCYPGALEKSYDHFRLKESRRLASLAQVNGGAEKAKKEGLGEVSLEDFDFIAFHSPYGKLVQKGFARLLYNDFLSNPTAERFSAIDPALLLLARETTILNKDVEKAFMAASKSLFAEKTLPSTLTSKKLGNLYTASLYASLASLLDNKSAAELKGKRIGMFSYGSGLAASFFSLRVKGDTSIMRTQLDLEGRLGRMEVRSCEEYVAALKLREEKNNLESYTPDGKVADVTPGAYYLEHNDDKHRRTYKISPLVSLNGSV